MARDWRRRFVLIAIALSLGAVSAGAETWAAVGPQGGDARALAADPRDPRVVYLGTANGNLYRSDDAGRRWKRQEPGFPLRGMSLDDIVVSPEGTLFVGYWSVSGPGGGVARSDDGGRTFTVLPDISGQSVRALALAPSDPAIVLAGTLTGIFRSGDGGRSWSRISPIDDPEIKNLDSVAVDPQDPQTIFAGTWHLPWKTTDGGRSWKRVHAGMIDDSDVMTLTLDRRSPQTVYATACSGIYRSTNGAARWFKVPGIPASSRRTRAFTQDREAADTFYAGTTEGLWASKDGTTTWRLVTSKDLVVNAVVSLPGGAVLLGTDGAGVLRREGHAEGWQRSNDGFSERFVSRIAFDVPRGRLFATVLGDRSYGGVLAAPSAAGPWEKLAPGLEGREALALDVLPGGAVLAGTDNGIFTTSGDGAPWRRLLTLIGGIEAQPRATDVAALSDSTFLAATAKGLLRSVNGGKTWQVQSLGLGGSVSAVARAKGQPGVALAATPFGIFRTGDLGAAWTLVSEPLGRSSVHAIHFLPGNDDVVFATTSQGLYRSTDQGRTWTPRGGGLPLLDITGLGLHPDGRTAFASAFNQGGVWRSEDAGQTWSAVATSGLLSERIWTLAVDPRGPAILAAAATGGLQQLSLPSTGGAAAAAGSK
jgi:photosystem II stability/assembly factor-like uncharacterized protein